MAKRRKRESPAETCTYPQRLLVMYPELSELFESSHFVLAEYEMLEEFLDAMEQFNCLDAALKQAPFKRVQLRTWYARSPAFKKLITKLNTMSDEGMLKLILSRAEKGLKEQVEDANGYSKTTLKQHPQMYALAHTVYMDLHKGTEVIDEDHMSVDDLYSF